MSRFGEIDSNAEYASKNNLAATTAPTIGDDSGDGYEAGSLWVDTTGDVAYICVDPSLGTAVWKEVTVDAYIPTWSPTAITLGDGVTSGASLALSAGAGYYAVFDPISDDEMLFTIGLDRNGIAYDGSGLIIDLYWMKFGATGGTVLWELDYYFAVDGANSYTSSDGTVTNSVDVTARTNQIQYTDSLPTITGNVGDTHLQLTLRRNSAGGGSDTYLGDAELYGINIRKV